MYYHRIVLTEPREITKELNQDNRSPSWDLKSRLLKYEAGQQRTLQLHSLIKKLRKNLLNNLPVSQNLLKVDYAGLQVLTAVAIKYSTVWDIMPWNQEKVIKRMGRTFFLHLQGRIVNQTRNQETNTAEYSCEISVRFHRTTTLHIPADTEIFLA